MHKIVGINVALSIGRRFLSIDVRGPVFSSCPSSPRRGVSALTTQKGAVVDPAGLSPQDRAKVRGVIDDYGTELGFSSATETEWQ